MIIEITDDTFDALVIRASLPVLLDFTAAWCGPCKMITPVLRQIAAEQEGRLVVAQLDVDANPATMRATGVMGMPTLRLYRDGTVLTEVVGARPRAALMRVLEEYIPALAAGRA